jgi:iron(III) transport system ATP-binding protein
MADLSISNIRKTYGEVVAVNDVTLQVQDGEFFTLLGPSGCGKSTLLAMLAGLEVPDGGSIRVGDRVFSDQSTGRFLPPERRDCGLVFQSYALWPHMTVNDNLRFGLKVRRVPRAEQDRRVQEVLAMVGLSRHGRRYPHELSGGQQQRAALARTLVSHPSVLLLDEPLSNLDAKLRDQARQWLRDIHDEVGVTTIYVTHDQEEALALSSRVAVLDAGTVQQVADPVTLYERPSTRLVAEFVGTTHFVEAEVLDRRDGHITVQPRGSVGSWSLSLDGAVEDGQPFTAGTGVEVAVRPEVMRLAQAGSDPAALDRDEVDCAVSSVSYVGGAYLHTVSIGASRVHVMHDRAIVGPAARIRLISPSLPIFPTPADVKTVGTGPNAPVPSSHIPGGRNDDAVSRL